MSSPLDPLRLTHFNFHCFIYISFLLAALSHRFAFAPHVFVDPLRVARLEIQFWWRSKSQQKKPQINKWIKQKVYKLRCFSPLHRSQWKTFQLWCSDGCFWVLYTWNQQHKVCVQRITAACHETISSTGILFLPSAMLQLYWFYWCSSITWYGNVAHNNLLLHHEAAPFLSAVRSLNNIAAEYLQSLNHEWVHGSTSRSLLKQYATRGWDLQLFKAATGGAILRWNAL